MARPQLIFTTYADGAFEKNFKWNGFFARHFMGADRLFFRNRRDLEKTDLYQRNKAIFDAKRGAGYWAWKPWVILEALKSANPGDIVVYQDCGVGYRYKTFLRPRMLLKRVREKGFLAGVLAPQYGPSRKWVHRHCLEQVGAYTPAYLDAPTVEASVSMWQCGAASIDFVSEWLANCLELDKIRDVLAEELSLQDPLFVEHRYDQAILTMLAIKYDAPAIEPFSMTNPFSKSIAILEIDDRAKAGGFYFIMLKIFCNILSLRRGARA